MFTYNEALTDTATMIFLNFYQCQHDNVLLTIDDTSDIIDILSVDYEKDIKKIEKDISMMIKSLVSCIPQQNLHTGVIYH